MMPNKLDGFEAQGFSSDSTMALRGFADELLGPSMPPQPQVTLYTTYLGHSDMKRMTVTDLQSP
jgi:hypothetical protein